MKPQIAGVYLASALALAASPQASAPQRRITAAVRDDVRVHVAGGVHPLVRVSTDLGAVAAGEPVRRLVLVLRRSPQQEADLRQLLAAQQQPGAPQFHRWLAPAEFGARFGVGDADLAVISSWLGSHGLSVDQVSAGRSMIEASGAEDQVAAAFGTRLHRYAARGREFIANAEVPTIPLALAAVVAGPLSLNDLGRGTPGAEFTLSRNEVAPGFEVAPGDFAKIYAINPLYVAGIDGQGAGIAVVARTDIPMSSVASFRASLIPAYPSNLPVVIHNGADPGILTSAETNEASLDADWAGAVAPAAAVDLVVSASTDVTDGVDLSAEYIVDHALAPIMSNSFGACEAALGGPGSAANLFYQNLYEQAAAEGITVVVSSGDTGSAGCDSSTGAASQGLGVNGLASTPFDLAVGGTQFSPSDAYWSPTNSPTDFSSALGYIPESAWNESCSSGGCLASGGGGASALYAKPDWQAGPGVPGDGARDLPDVSLDAGLGVPYVTCNGTTCPPGGYSTGAGTSAAAQAFASALALLVQKTGQWQGMIAPELYRLAASQPAGACNAATGPGPSCIFNDVTTGSNAVPCEGGSPNCSDGTTAQGNGTPAYAAGTGYDLATGLGSVNFANLIDAWPTSSPVATATTLTAAPTATTHGQAITCQVVVSSGGATPTGSVEVEAAGNVLGTAQVQAGAATLRLNDLLGGTNALVARFVGTSAFAPSTSDPVSVQVAPEASSIVLTARQEDILGNGTATASTYYGSYMALDAAVAGTSGVGTNSGTVSFNMDGAPLGSGTLPLNGGSTAGIALPLLAVGSHQFGAAFSGDSSLDASAAPIVNLLVRPAPTITTVPKVTATTAADGSESVIFGASVVSSLIELRGAAMAGTITVTDPSGRVIASEANFSQFGGPFFGDTFQGGATFRLTLPAGPPTQITAHYSGDGNFQPSDAAPVTIDDGNFHLTAKQADLTVAPGGTAIYEITATLDTPLMDPVVKLACAELCSASVLSVTLTPSAPQATFTVSASALALARMPTGSHWPLWPQLAWVGLATLAFACGRRRSLRLWACAGIVLAATACGGTPAAQLQNQSPPPMTFTVTATSGYHVSRANLTLKVAP